MSWVSPAPSDKCPFSDGQRGTETETQRGGGRGAGTEGAAATGDQREAPADCSL